ncbi:MAG: shikimate dehydrogenase [Anaerolineales bacterium]
MTNLQPSNLPTFKLGLIGYPVSHSLSPKIQNAALAACELDGDYSLFPIPPDDIQGLRDLLARVRSSEITGLNVTIPHKQNVIPLLDELTSTAQSIGAVNVIYMKDGKLIGDNTDAQGFLSDLKKFMAGAPSPVFWDDVGSVREKSALILGAGGSARSVVYALYNDGWDVAVNARRIEQAEQLVSQFKGVKASNLNFEMLPPFNKLKITLSNFQLIVNTTPVGMTPKINQSPLPRNVSPSKYTMIYDLVYNPRETKLVRNARAKGNHATTGLGMLIEQAALGFAIWTGRIPPLEILYQAVQE